MTATDTMPQTDRDTFLSALRAADLVSDRQYDCALAGLSPSARSAREVADHFQKSDVLTRFQVERLLSGRGDGFHIGAYLILDYLGKSATGRVYKARHRTMNRLVAIKILALDRTGTEEVRAGVRAEARAAARLAHTNIVTLLDANQVGERMYFVKEYLEGGDLGATLRAHGPFPVRRACEVIRQAALGLQHAHELGVAHGRLSPAAILVGSAGRGADDKPLVKVSGFGLGRWGADGEEPDFECRAPEQFADPDHSGPQADLYSLGCVLHTLLAGRAPFPASCAAEAGWHHLHSAPPALADLRPDVPAPLARFVLRLLGKDPALRPATAADASRFLQMYADGDESGDTVEFAEAHAVTSGAASVISRSLSGPFADLPHEPLFADDLSPEPTMVLDTADPPTPRTALGERTPLAVAKRKSKRILPKAADRRKPARPQYGRPEAVNRFALAGLVVGVCLGVLFAIVCILKIYAATKG